MFEWETICGCRDGEAAVHGLSKTIVGVLGGGQLGRMLCQAASQMAIKVMVLDPQENCPASALSYQHMVGSFDDSATVEEFAKRFNFSPFWKSGLIYFCVLSLYLGTIHASFIGNDLFVC